ncbi:hypothetical protein SapgrDRAFT_1401 [Saprospira grandis DSM 2844]|uniref:Uncharacterized protein n=1 Tax=Saprospira grandis DSM 2844 TaxID=694433 RepID=J0P6L7_9BACT|nr:hypothetical protein [Saprospira grandis]EJF53117.1 hypothetical protein SapgrDRAFT_1401 [Saprospira grandis DSM 2844]
MQFNIHIYSLFFSCLLLLAHNCSPHAHDEAEEGQTMDWLHLLFEGHSSLAHGQEEAFQFVEQSEEEDVEQTLSKETATKKQAPKQLSYQQLLFVAPAALEQALLAKFLAQLQPKTAIFKDKSALMRLLASTQAGRAPPIYG